MLRSGGGGGGGSQGAPGANGTDGATWRSGSGAPSNALGKDTDFYINTATQDVYQRASGTYSIITNIKGTAGANGANGAIWSFGTGTPASGFGNVGDNFLATDTSNYYNKANSTTWNLVGNLKGANGTNGASPSITAVATQLAAGSTPTAVVTGTSPNLTLTLGIPTLNSSILRTGIGTQIAFTVSTVAGSNTGSFLIPANTVTNTQAFFQVDAYFTATNDAMTKAVTLSIGGQNIATFSTTTGSRGNGLEQTGMNRGALNSQVWKPLAANGGLGTSAQVGITATTIDWTVDNTFLVTVAVSGTVVAGSTATCEYVNLIIFN